jgi:hypothetical protein
MVEWIEMRPVGLEFLDQAPMRVDVEVSTKLSRNQVWAAFVDPTTWPSWFPSVREAAYPNQPLPYGVGTIRTADVSGELFEETILAWDTGLRWTYRIDRCTANLASAQVESTVFSNREAGGTAVHWILASDPSEQFAAAGDVLPGILEARLAEALRNLEQMLLSDDA